MDGGILNVNICIHYIYILVYCLNSKITHICEFLFVCLFVFLHNADCSVFVPCFVCLSETWLRS